MLVATIVKYPEDARIIIGRYFFNSEILHLVGYKVLNVLSALRNSYK